MPRVGLKRFRYAKLTEGDPNTWATPATLAAAIECKVSLDLNEASLYADDVLKERDTSFKKGTITIGVDEDDDTIVSALLGQASASKTVGTGEGAETVTEYTSKEDDVAAAVGFGHIVTKIVGGVKKYKVEWFPKVTFKPFIADAKTKGESLEFVTPSIEGTIMPLADGTWEKHATFANEAHAQTYLDSLFVQAQN